MLGEGYYSILMYFGHKNASSEGYYSILIYFKYKNASGEGYYRTPNCSDDTKVKVVDT